MDEQRRLTKKELKLQRKLERLEKAKDQGNTNLFKWTAIIFSALIFIGLFSFIVIQSKQTPAVSEVKVSSQDWVRGDKNAKNTLVEFSDFECPACKAYEPFTETLLRDYNGKLKLVYKEYPLPSHQNGMAATTAAEAAGRQGKFWEMHDLLFSRQDEWTAQPDPTPLFKQYAQTLKLDVTKFEQDLKSDQIKAKIEADQNEGTNLGVNATPTFFINGKQIQNVSNYGDLRKEVEQNFVK